jgi:rubredoxin
MRKYKCSLCSYIYDPQNGDPENSVAPGTAFEDLPDYCVYPECGADKDAFEQI